MTARLAGLGDADSEAGATRLGLRVLTKKKTKKKGPRRVGHAERQSEISNVTTLLRASKQTPVSRLRREP